MPPRQGRLRNDMQAGIPFPACSCGPLYKGAAFSRMYKTRLPHFEGVKAAQKSSESLAH